MTQAFLLSTLREVSADRLHRAVASLVEKNFSLTLTRHKDTEIRALLLNGDGKEYGVTLTEGSISCSCKDALYRGVVCKHAALVALSVLRTPEQPSVSPLIHLTKGATPAAPRLCGSQDFSLPAWVIPFVPAEPWEGRTCIKCWALYKQPLTLTA